VPAAFFSKRRKSLEKLAQGLELAVGDWRVESTEMFTRALYSNEVVHSPFRSTRFTMRLCARTRESAAILFMNRLAGDIREHDAILPAGRN
jgi:hypothetical protein